MRIKLFYITSFILIIFSFQITYGENIDSLLIEIQKTDDDSVRSSLLNTIAWDLKYTDQEASLKYARQSLKIALQEKINSVAGNARNTIGVVEYIQGNYADAKFSLEEALKIRLEIHDHEGAGKTYNNLGLISSAQSDYPSAIKYYMSSLSIAETIGNVAGEASILNNIGQIYFKQENIDKAMDYFSRSLSLHRKLGDVFNEAINLNNIGSIYFEKEDFESALKYYRQGLSMRIVAKDKAGEYNSLQNIGNMFNNLNQHDSALFYLEAALNGKYSIEDNQKIPTILLNLAFIYMKQGNKEKAHSFLDQSLQEAEDQESLDEMKESYLGLSELYNAEKNYKVAFSYYKKFTDLKDSIYDSSTMDKIASMQTVYETEKRDKEIEILNKDKEIQEAKFHTATIIRNSLLTGLGIVGISLIVIFFQKKRINRERKRSDELLLNILPEETAVELKATGKAKTKSHQQVSVLFTDFRNFTLMGEILTPEELVNEINYCYTAFDDIVFRNGLEKIKTIGDSYMCAGGLSTGRKTSVSDTIKTAIEIRDFMNKLKEERILQKRQFFGLRIGIHTGPVIAGVVGTRKFAYDIWGDTVNVASRMESSGEEGKINISGTTYSHIKDNFSCTYRGKIEAKNKGTIEMYFVN